MITTHQEVIDLYANFGIKATFNSSCLDSGCVYEDNHVALGMDKANLPVSLHELAHWLVVDPSRRKLPNYGLGPHPEEREGKPPVALGSSDLTQHLEALACELHVRMALYYFDHSAALKVADYLCVSSYDADKIAPQELTDLKTLQEMGALDKHFRFDPESAWEKSR